MLVLIYQTGGQMNPIIKDLIKCLTADDLFTEQEAVLLLRSVKADRKDDLPGNIEKVIRWARETRSRQAVLDVILTMAKGDAIAIQPTPDGKDLQVGLTLDPKEVQIR
jgi:hypothetical protein